MRGANPASVGLCWRVANAWLAGIVACCALGCAVAWAWDTGTYPLAPEPLRYLVALQGASLLGWLGWWRFGGGANGRLLLCTALLTRLLLFAAPPTTSNDWARYAWDGAATLAVGSPYAHVPSSDSLAPLRTVAPWRHLHHRDLPGVYPPVAQGAFVAAWSLGAATTTHPATHPWRGSWPFKLLFGLAELCALALLWRGGWRDAARIAAVCPLAAWEVWGQGHVDGLALPFVVLAFGWWRERGASAAGALALASLVKPPLALLFSTWLWRPRARRRIRELAGAAAVALGLVALSYAPLLPEAPSWSESWRMATQGLRTLAAHWEFNGGLAHWVDRGLTAALRPLWLPLTAGIALALAWHWSREPAPSDRTVAHRWATLLLVGFLLSRTLYPWYALWLLPLAAVGRHVTALILVASASAGHLVLVEYASSGRWELGFGAGLVTWGAPAAWLGYRAWYRARGRPPT